jgi:hypothetical protein
MKSTIFFTLLIALSVQAVAQSVSEVWAEKQNLRIAVHYTLKSNQAVDVFLQYSNDNGLSWKACKSITGD